MGAIKCIIAAGGLGTRLKGFRDNQSTKILLKVNHLRYQTLYQSHYLDL